MRSFWKGVMWGAALTVLTTLLSLGLWIWRPQVVEGAPLLAALKPWVFFLPAIIVAACSFAVVKSLRNGAAFAGVAISVAISITALGAIGFLLIINGLPNIRY